MAPGASFERRLILTVRDRFGPVRLLDRLRRLYACVSLSGWQVCQVDYPCLSGPWFKLRCSFSTSLRLMIASHSWKINLKLWRRNRVLTPSRPPFHLYVMPFRSQERFMILGRHPPTWKPWCERPAPSPMRKQTTTPQF